MQILYQDKEIVVCVKPIGVESEDGKAGNCMPSLLREALHLPETAPIFTVHRLDKQVSGVMVYAKTKAAAASLSAQMQAHQFTKQYRAIVEGTLPDIESHCGRWEDLLYHDKRKNKVFTVKKQRKGVKRAALRYAVLGQTVLPETNKTQPTATQQNTAPEPTAPKTQTHEARRNQYKKTATPNASATLLQITLETGRTHQIRVQAASRTLPLLGDARYGSSHRNCDIALFSHTIGFLHPITKEALLFTQEPPNIYPWNLFIEKEA